MILFIVGGNILLLKILANIPDAILLKKLFVNIQNLSSKVHKSKFEYVADQ